MARKLRPEIEIAIQEAAKRHGLDPRALRSYVLIESGGNPNTQTGSYKGLTQLSDAQFRKYGGQGNIFDVNDNLNAGAAKISSLRGMFQKRYGREPTAGELYLIHQQGWGGAQAHWDNPDQPAWQSMASTGEGRSKGPGWAKRAIWGNVPTDVRSKYGSVDNITSRQFAELWDGKVSRFGGGGSSSGPQVQVASATSPSATGPSSASGIPSSSVGSVPSSSVGSVPSASGGLGNNVEGVMTALFGGGNGSPQGVGVNVAGMIDGQASQVAMAQNAQAAQAGAAQAMAAGQQALAELQQKRAQQQPLDMNRVLGAIRNRTRLA